MKALKRTPPEATAPSESEPEDARGWIARALTHVEDVVYVGLGVLLTGAALSLLVDGGVQFVSLLTAGNSLPPSGGRRYRDLGADSGSSSSLTSSVR